VNQLTEKTPEEKTPLIDNKGLRSDGRKLNELRPIHLEVGYLSRPNGSAYIEHGRNKIIAAVWGPRELHPRHLAISDRALLRVTYRMATFSVSDRKRPAPSRREHEISMVIRQALEPMLFLELYPRAAIDVFINVLEADGGSRCASATVASLALADAGIPMRGLVAGVASGKIEGKIAVDMDDIEDKIGEADLPVVMSPERGDITLLQMDGKLTPKELAQALRMAEEGIHQIHEMQKAVLLEKYAKIRDEVGEVPKDSEDDIMDDDLLAEVDEDAPVETEKPKKPTAPKRTRTTKPKKPDTDEPEKKETKPAKPRKRTKPKEEETS
jgi:exosome complex component RRP41